MRSMFNHSSPNSIDSINFKKRLAGLLTLTLILSACTNKNTQPPQAQANTSPQPVQSAQPAQTQAQTTPASNSSQTNHPPLERVFWTVCNVTVFHQNTTEQYHETGISGYYTKGCVDNKKRRPLIVWGPTLQGKMVKDLFMSFGNKSSGKKFYVLYINSKGCVPYFNRPQPQGYYKVTSGFSGDPVTTIERRPISDEDIKTWSETKSLIPFIGVEDECSALNQANNSY